jgi:hypothetical protein
MSLKDRIAAIPDEWWRKNVLAHDDPPCCPHGVMAGPCAQCGKEIVIPEAVTLRVRPVTHAIANEFVRRLHRHNRPTLGSIMCAGVERDGELCGVAIAGRPVARMLDDGMTLEITRVCTDGTRNACSILYAAIRKAAKALGYRRVFTYTLPEEGGASLRAAGYVCDGAAGNTHAAWHNRLGRKVEAVGDDLVGGKLRWKWDEGARR